jgi:hypothetical protein
MDKNILKAKNQGKLIIADRELICAVLDDGTRVISISAVFKAFGRTKRGRKQDEVRAANMPSFIDANNLQPYISSELRSVLQPIEYQNKNGTITAGYKAEILPLLCDAYLAAREASALTKQQLPLAIVSEMLVRSLSKVGIIALVDEATGYQEARAKDDLQKFLSIYLSEEKLAWAKMFPDEYYKHLFRLWGWSYDPMSVKRPKLVGKLTNQLVYEKLPSPVLERLREVNPIKNPVTYRRGATHFQYLSAELGQPDLRDHLLQLIAIMRASPNKDVFLRNFARAFPTDGEQLSLDIDDD